jgi:hypothetical protein
MFTNPRGAQAKAFILSVHLLLPPLALANHSLTSGTIIVVAQTKDRIIVAADSRTGTTDGVAIESIDDSACKIAAFRSHAVFAASGVLGAPAKQWTATSLAAEVLKNSSLSPLTSNEGGAILDGWAKSMVHRLFDSPRDQLHSIALANNGLVTTGILAGIEKNKSAWLRAGVISLATTGGLSYEGFSLSSNDPPTAYHFLGKSQVAMEFNGDSSGRAIEERRAWSRKNMTGQLFDRFKTYRLVELTIMYHPNKTDVGGPVDEIELDPSGVRWLHRKSNCPEIYQ